MKSFLFTFFIIRSVFGADLNPGWIGKIEKIKTDYGLSDLYVKKVNDKGEGYQPLEELRNFRVVLHGVLYRSGANNSYNKHHKRDNENPLSNQGLKSLCEQNFSTAFYLYKKNYAESEKSISCKKNQLTYTQLSALDEKNEFEFLETIFKNIKQQKAKPILVHCWNGWHASGLISALALRQFCQFNSNEATDYWVKNTDGNSKGYGRIMKRIQNFQPKKEFRISSGAMKEICPVIGSAKD